jgi:hypothetical protein
LAAGAFSIERLEGSQFGRDRTFAVSVDEAVAVEKFDRENLGPLPVTTDDGVLTQFGSRGKTEALVLGDTTNGEPVPRGKPWDRQPISGKLRRKFGVCPGFAAYFGPPA